MPSLWVLYFIGPKSVFIVGVATYCGNRVLYAECSKLGKLTSEILNDLQLIVRSYKYLNICNPPLKMNG